MSSGHTCLRLRIKNASVLFNTVPQYDTCSCAVIYSINCSLLGQLLLLCVVIDVSIMYITEKKKTLPNIYISQLLNQPLNKLKRASSLYLNFTHVKIDFIPYRTQQCPTIEVTFDKYTYYHHNVSVALSQ